MPGPVERSKVLYLVPTLLPGGAERQLVELVDHLDRTQFAPLIVTVHGERDAPIAIRPRDCRIISLEKRAGKWGAVGTLWRLRRLLRSERPAIVHSFLNRANHYARVGAMLAGSPPVITSVRIRVRGVWTPWDRLSERILWRKSRLIIVNSDLVRQELTDELGLPTSRIAVVHNGVDLERFHPTSDKVQARRTLGMAPDALWFGMVARYEPRKGHDVLLDAFLRFRNAHPERNSRLLLVGHVGDSGTYEAVRRFVREHGLQSSVDVRLGIDKIEEAYQALDFLILPSRHEGSPNVLLEALACGIPCIASRAADTTGILEVGMTGWAFDTDRADDLGRILADAASLPPPAYRKLSQACRARAAERHSSESMGRQIEQHYEASLMTIRPRVAFVHNRCTEYRRDVFHRLAGGFDVDFYFVNEDREHLPPNSHVLRGIRIPYASDYEWVPQLGPSLRRARQRFPFDLYCSADVSYHITHATYRAARRERKPFVLWNAHWMNMAHPRRWLMRTLENRIFRNASAVVVYGSKARDYAVRRGANPDRTFVAHNASPYGYVKSRPHAVDALRRRLQLTEGPVVLFLGRLVNFKGLPVLLRAFRDVENEVPGVQLVVAGTGPALPSLERLAKTLGCRRVHFTRTRVEGDEEKSLLFSLADTLVLPSVYHRGPEPWGLVLNEAATAGLPLIATDMVGASGDLVRDGESGLVVPAGDAKALAKAVRWMIEHPHEAREMGRRARKIVSAFTSESIADTIAKAFEQALTDEPPQGTLTRAETRASHVSEVQP